MLLSLFQIETPPQFSRNSYVRGGSTAGAGKAAQ
jgi:hypothetical protein